VRGLFKTLEPGVMDKGLEELGVDNSISDSERDSSKSKTLSHSAFRFTNRGVFSVYSFLFFTLLWNLICARWDFDRLER